jgi:hypothetical protein
LLREQGESEGQKYSNPAATEERSRFFGFAEMLEWS